MKPFRPVHALFGVLALVPLLYIAAALVVSVFREAESSRIEGLQPCLQKKLETYRFARGEYPDSLQALTFTNSPQEMRAQPILRKMTYRRTDSGYQVSYKGWYHYTLSVSNQGASVSTTLKSRI